MQKEIVSGITQNPFDAFRVAAHNTFVEGAVTADGEHFLVRIDHSHRAAAACLEAKRDVARATADVDEGHIRPGRQPINQDAFPQTMNAQTHQVIHQVVTTSDAGEDIGHQ